ncbi:adenylate/guanylate cyclase [Magnetococcus marinus MC-1]|uniref:Adenylate/guanylate cyclase n=1 Tax=Magnetococcus marinus (strain ATCC BAA-1437 / JCM 17883 / MC-1) TaxID=156889 RepID=A0L6H1_MAGMM|nr:adenylate/guanylate cyclase domain-containing protein [Magnetococcus marinus]ABK43564.1 adenylate/guanylate cyclase [Magnetococcus marinus MC-1]
MAYSHRKTPFHINILSVLSLLLLGATCSIIWFNYDRSHFVTIESAWSLMEEKSEKIFERIQGVYTPIIALTDAAAANPALKSDLHLLEAHPSQAYLIATLRASRDIYAVLVGFDNGDFHEAANLEPYPHLREKLGAPAKTVFGIKHIVADAQGKRMSLWYFLDEQEQLLGQSEPQPDSYDPRQRPWYKKAQESTKTVKSDLYIYSFLQQPGVTFSQRFNGDGRDGVVGMDVTLSSISRFLRQQSITQAGEVFTFNAEGALTAYPDANKAMVSKLDPVSGQTKLQPAQLSDLNNPLIEAVHRQFKSRFTGHGPMNSHTFMVTVGGVQHLGTLSPVASRFGNGEYLALTAPLKHFVEPIEEVLHQSLLISLAIVLAMLPLSYWIALRIARSIKALTEEAKRIGRFELDGPVHVVSNIDEIHTLATAIGAMKATLNTFGRYAPKALVRQLMANHAEVALGGKRQPLTLMFTDVKEFTNMAEGMPPEALMRKVSAYFEVLGGAVLAQEGTIDKFIGDALMAFWNAPNEVADHTFKGCLAALESKHRMQELNQTWQTQGQAIMVTRFGLHADDMVVGNVGSSDRMDYTVMGAAVNLTARLEGLNKYYGTTILVSESVKIACQERILVRSVDRVMAKGTSIPVKVYELLGLVGEGPDYLQVSAAQIERCQRWEIAKARYLEQDWKGAIEQFSALAAEDSTDELAQIYIKRCGQYTQEPPPVAWDGVCHFSTK